MIQDPLTAREKEAARIAAQGRTNKDVALQMGVTKQTVEQYLNRAYSKLGVTDRSQLAYKTESLK